MTLSRTSNRPGRVLLVLSLVGLAACDWPWPRDNELDPKRCDPRCSGGQRCVSGQCVEGDAGPSDGPEADSCDACRDQQADQVIQPDQQADLVIQPDLGPPSTIWAVSAGGKGSETGKGIGVDGQGNSYVTGHFGGNAIFGTLNLVSTSGAAAVFLAKLDPSGTSFLWAKQSSGGTNAHSAYDIAVDNAGNSFITGSFATTASFGPFTLTSKGGQDVFVAKFDSAGNPQWAVRGGSTLNDNGDGIATDGGGNAFVTGHVEGTSDFGSFTVYGKSAFTAKVSTDGQFLWASGPQGSGGSSGAGIAVDSQGYSYVAGTFSGDVSFNQPMTSASGDAFVVQLNKSGIYQWAKQLGGADSDDAADITLSGAGGDLLVTGTFKGSASFGSTTLTALGTRDLYVAKLDSTGQVLWASQASSTDTIPLNIYPRGIAAAGQGSSFVTGTFSGAGTFGTISIPNTSSYPQAFLAQLDGSGKFLSALKPDAKESMFGYGVATDAQGSAYVTGYYYVGATIGTFNLVPEGGSELFVWKYGY